MSQKLNVCVTTGQKVTQSDPRKYEHCTTVTAGDSQLPPSGGTECLSVLKYETQLFLLQESKHCQVWWHIPFYPSTRLCVYDLNAHLYREGVCVTQSLANEIHKPAETVQAWQLQRKAPFPLDSWVDCFHTGVLQGTPRRLCHHLYLETASFPLEF